MRYQQTNERRAVILMVVLSLLTLFALVGVTFVLYADAEAAAARVAREAQTMQTADVNPEEALAYFLGQLIYDVPDLPGGVGSGLRGHSLARTMYGYNYTVPSVTSLNVFPFDGPGRLHYASGSALPYPAIPTSVPTNVPNNFLGIMDDYALVNYTWFSGDGFLRDPERYGVRANPLVPMANPYVGANAPYTYPDLNNFFLAAMRADGTVLTPSYHRPWLFQVVGGKFYAFNDMTNPNWGLSDPTNKIGKYMTLRPRPLEHPNFPLPGDPTGDVKNLPWAPGGNDSIWVDLGAPVMTAPDGTQYKMMFAPLIVDLDGRVNMNTAGNLLAYISAMTAASGAGGGSASWQMASNAHVSNQGWGPWEVNLSKVLWGDQAVYPTPSTTPPTPPEWMRLLTGMSYATTTPPNVLPFIVQPGVIPPTPLSPGLSAWLLPGVRGRYLETAPGGVKLWTPTVPAPLPGSTAPLYPSAIGLNTTLQHSYAQSDENGLNETSGGSTPTLRPVLQTPFPSPTFESLYPSFLLSGYGNGGAEGANHPLLYNVFQSPFTTSNYTRAFRAGDMSALLRPNASINGPVNPNASAVTSDLLRLCPSNFPPDAVLATLPASVKTAIMRFRNLVTTQSWDIGAPGVIPYWWNGMTTGFLGYTGATPLYQLAPYAAQPATGLSLGFPPLPPTPAVSFTPGSPMPLTSEFGPDWSSVSTNSATYFPTTNPPGYVTPGARIRLNRPLPPYPHMGALLTPPYAPLPPAATLSPYGVAYNLATPAIANQYAAAQNARQALANDIYRRLAAITGLVPPAAPAAPTQADLAPRRWLAQLAVNIVDFIDEDDIMTPFNFYTTADSAGAPLTPTTPPTGTNPPQTQGPDDPTPTGANPDYWVFGTELPKVVLNEVLAEAKTPLPSASGADTVKVWVELFNTMPGTAGTNTQRQDQWRVPLYMTIPGGGGYSPYRVSIAQYTMNRANTPTTLPPATFPPQIPDSGANVLGKAYVAAPLPQSTTDADFSGVIPLSQNLATPAPMPTPTQPPFTVPGSGNIINAGVDAGNYFLLGPTPDTTNYPRDPFTYPGVPINIPVQQTASMTYPRTWTADSTTDERNSGVTVMLRRLANPYLPLQTNPTLPNYNPYVTVDYIQSVPLQTAKPAGGSAPTPSFGKRQPFAGLLLGSYTGPGAFAPSPTSPVYPQLPNPTPPPPGAITTTTNVTDTFGFANYPLPQSGHYDWLVHLDRTPISPMELLHVSGFAPYMLTQQFMLGDDTKATIATGGGGSIVNSFAHYAPWFDALPVGESFTTPPNVITCPWWFDPALPAGNSHRLYRLFEFLECGDRAFGVNGLGRIPGKVNINTIWDPEILQALIDANLSMGTATTLPSAPLAYAPVNPATGLPWNPAPGTDQVSQIFANMVASRSPSYYNLGTYTNPISIGPVNMGTGADDRPFLPLSTGQYLPKTAGGGLQFPNGISVSTDTILRTNNPPPGKTPTYPTTTSPASNNWLLFQQYTDTQATHPYYQTQLLTKLYNNITTRSNTFAVFLTVGFFQVIPGGAIGQPNIPQLGPEIGRTEGKHIRHRMFSLVDRTNLTTFTTASLTGTTGITSVPLNMTGTQTIQLPVLPPPLTITGTATQLFVPNPTTGVPGLIQAGTQLVIDAGNVNEETVTVSAVTPPVGLAPATITANFTLPHVVGFTITQRGNPGPWILTPYDPRLDPSVVPYFSIID